MSYRGKIISFASEFFFKATRQRVAIWAAEDQPHQPDLVRPSSLQGNQLVTSSKSELFPQFGQP